MPNHLATLPLTINLNHSVIFISVLPALSGYLSNNIRAVPELHINRLLVGIEIHTTNRRITASRHNPNIPQLTIDYR